MKRLLGHRWGNGLLRIPLAWALCTGAAASALAQTAPTPATSGPAASLAKPIGAEQGPTWSSLKPSQREALKPLQRDWAGIDSLGKSKWIEIAERYPSMTPQDQARLETRMAEWAKMSPLERGQVRLNFQQAKQAPAKERQASWEAYQALEPEQRRELADRAAPAATNASRPIEAAAKSPPVARPDRLGPDVPQTKSNTVPDPALAARPKPVAPTVVQARPGVSTTLISKPSAPPAHQPSGLPKIAATPEFVDKKTLLPQTGAQSAARPAAASAPAARP